MEKIRVSSTVAKPFIDTLEEMGETHYMLNRSRMIAWACGYLCFVLETDSLEMSEFMEWRRKKLSGPDSIK